MNSQLLLTLNIFFGAALVLYFILGRSKSRQPTRLNMKAGSTPVFMDAPLQQTEAGDDSSARILTSSSSSSTSDESEDFTKGAGSPTTRQLSVPFMYNGHDWEAHDVLGIPQGASLAVATESYQKLIKVSDPSTFEFYEAAYKAILKKYQRRF